jgi:hypothetical protein
LDFIELCLTKRAFRQHRKELEVSHVTVETSPEGNFTVRFHDPAKTFLTISGKVSREGKVSYRVVQACVGFRFSLRPYLERLLARCEW